MAAPAPALVEAPVTIQNTDRISQWQRPSSMDETEFMTLQAHAREVGQILQELTIMHGELGGGNAVGLIISNAKTILENNSQTPEGYKAFLDQIAGQINQQKQSGVGGGAAGTQPMPASQVKAEDLNNNQITALVMKQGFLASRDQLMQSPQSQEKQNIIDEKRNVGYREVQQGGNTYMLFTTYQYDNVGKRAIATVGFQKMPNGDIIKVSPAELTSINSVAGTGEIFLLEDTLFGITEQARSVVKHPLTKETYQTNAARLAFNLVAKGYEQEYGANDAIAQALQSFPEELLTTVGNNGKISVQEFSSLIQDKTNPYIRHLVDTGIYMNIKSAKNGTGLLQIFTSQDGGKSHDKLLGIIVFRHSDDIFGPPLGQSRWNKAQQKDLGHYLMARNILLPINVKRSVAWRPMSNQEAELMTMMEALYKVESLKRRIHIARWWGIEYGAKKDRIEHRWNQFWSR